MQPTSWMRLAGGLRWETFTFDVRNLCTTCAEQPAGRTSSSIVLPKMNLILGPWARTEFFANYGEGFHSNDARSAVAPGSSPLARARNYEIGVRSKPWGPGGVELIATIWRLDLQSELVFVGDEGTTEIRGPSRREGVEVGVRGQVSGPLYVNGSFTWTKAEFRNGDAIPLAPEYTAYGAVILKWPEGLTSQLQATYLGVRPLIEDRSVASPSWLNFDVSERYRLPITLPHGRMEAFLFVRNLFNTEWEQAIFAFESRLRTEAARGHRHSLRAGQSAYVHGRRCLVLLAAAENGHQQRSRLPKLLNVPQRVRFRVSGRLRPCWMSILSGCSSLKRHPPTFSSRKHPQRTPSGKSCSCSSGLGG